MAMKSALDEYYKKGEISVKDRDPKEEFKNISSNTIVVRVKRGSKIQNIMGFVEKSLKEVENKYMIFTGCGDAIEKTISCVEITKSKFKNLYQITRLSSLRVEEYWDPIKPDLDRLQVTREIPMVSILLSKEMLDSNELGYQGPESHINFRKQSKRKKMHSTSPTVDDSNVGQSVMSE